MGKFISIFDTTAELVTFSATTAFSMPHTSLTKDNSQVHYFNPYNVYVDLGLPSGTKWATMNIGANSITDTGLYFQWGDISGYTASQVGSTEGKKPFDWADYKWNEGSGSIIAISKYNAKDGKTVLDLEDDAVAANWGGSWKMPTEAQFQELLNTTYVTNTWVTDYQGSGINGRLFTSVRNGNTLFIPAAGGALDGIIYNVGTTCTVQSSYINNSSYVECISLGFTSSEISIGGLPRCSGVTVRGVIGV